MKVIATFDRVITEVLQEKVRLRMQFKVRSRFVTFVGESVLRWLTSGARRGTWIRIVSATKSGRSSFAMLISASTILPTSTPIK